MITQRGEMVDVSSHNLADEHATSGDIGVDH